MDNKCTWVLYKDLWHKECCGYLTTTVCGEENYTEIEIPDNRICPGCGKEIVVDQNRKFGRNY